MKFILVLIFFSERIYLFSTFSCSLREIIFWFFFGLFRSVSKQFCLFRLFRYRFETPKQTETNENYYFLVSRNKPKQTRNRSCFGLFRFEPNYYFFHFEDTLHWCQIRDSSRIQVHFFRGDTLLFASREAEG